MSEVTNAIHSFLNTGRNNPPTHGRSELIPKRPALNTPGLPLARYDGRFRYDEGGSSARPASHLTKKQFGLPLDIK